MSGHTLRDELQQRLLPLQSLLTRINLIDSVFPFAVSARICSFVQIVVVVKSKRRLEKSPLWIGHRPAEAT